MLGNRIANNVTHTLRCWVQSF